MFSKEQEEYLIRRLSRNEVVLFLGAGFSYDAKNSFGENIPMGKALSKKMWDFIGLEDEYIDDGTSLGDMYQALLSSGKKYEAISQFLRDNLIVKSFPEYYKYLTIPFWYKIYTTNIDDLLEKIYNRYSFQKYVSLKYPKDEFKERDQLLDSVQTIYLHGKLPCRPNEVIFSRRQYASSSLKLQPLYFHFTQDYATLPTIFIGTSLDEQLFEQYIVARQSRRHDIPENRPKSFLITPTISPIREKNLKTEYNIETIKATTEEFLLWIKNNSSKFPSKQDLLKILIPTLDILIDQPNYKKFQKRSINEFAISFSKIEIPQKKPTRRKDFLLGTTPTWSDIFCNLDAPRKITSEIHTHIESCLATNHIQCVGILGHAGSGKSTVLKRLCYNLVNEGRNVFYCYSENLPTIQSIIDSLAIFDERVVLAIDNAELVLKQLIGMIDQLNTLEYPPLIVLASRTNLFDKISSKYEPIKNLTEFQMRNLERDEIVDIIRKLDENNLLGYLKGLKPEQRIKEFENRAKKQILVAMREATHGEDFDVIIKSEFNDLANEEAKILCICVALATDAGFTLTKQDFVSFSAKPPAEALEILDRTLHGLVLKVGISDSKLLLRHRTIAEFLIERCTTPQLLKQAYIRVLSSLASEINVATYNSRKFNLYREIINHFMIFRRFSNNIADARDLYESLVDYFRDDYQFWLQYGSLELEGSGGDLALAENYLKQGESLYSSSYLKTALAKLYYKKSYYTKNITQSHDLKSQADDILIEIFKNRYINDPYAYHIFGVGHYIWIQKWIKSKPEIKVELIAIMKVIAEGVDRFPYDKKLKELKETINKAILLTAVNTDIMDFPLLYSDIERNSQTS